ncbi:GIY-YIG nuclease family protein [Clostridium rectalis]|uniref:GIY-YIG nuclease family protein n=1 Tax=Clostridium rectalis TaxID=2040295 RepID=UPI000F64055C|nr:GIY-YIG nuclease family protein [Clostridium rectalis]
MCYVYILQCSDSTLYTGWTNNLNKRIETHSKGKGAKYTRCRLPIKLVYYEKYENKISAQKREYAIKKFTREKKLLLIANRIL